MVPVVFISRSSSLLARLSRPDVKSPGLILSFAVRIPKPKPTHRISQRHMLPRDPNVGYIAWASSCPRFVSHRTRTRSDNQVESSSVTPSQADTERSLGTAGGAFAKYMRTYLRSRPRRHLCTTHPRRVCHERAVRDVPFVARAEMGSLEFST